MANILRSTLLHKCNPSNFVTSRIINKSWNKVSSRCFTSRAAIDQHSKSQLLNQVNELFQRSDFSAAQALLNPYINDSSQLINNVEILDKLLELYLFEDEPQKAAELINKLIGAEKQRFQTNKGVKNFISYTSALNRQLTVDRMQRDYAHISQPDALYNNFNTAAAELSAQQQKEALNSVEILTFLTNLARAYIDSKNHSKTEEIIERLSADIANPIATAHALNLQGLLNYEPPQHVHSEACSHGHSHSHGAAHDEAVNYNYEMAENYWQKALDTVKAAINQGKQGKTPEEMNLSYQTLSTIVDNLSAAHFTAQKLEKAEELVKRAQELLTELPQTNEHKLKLSFQLFQIYLQQRNGSAALQLLQPILALDSSNYSDINSEALQFIDNFAVLCYNIAAYNEAAAIMQKYLEMYNSLYPNSQNFFLAAKYNDCALAQLRIKQYQPARTHLLHAVRLKEQLLNGQINAEFVQTISNLALVEKRLGDFPNSEKNYNKAIEFAKKLQNLPEEQENSAHNSTILANLYGNLGELFIETKNYPQAEQYLTQALQQKKQILGDKSMQLSRDIHAVATCYLLQNKSAEAIRLYEELLENSKNATGSQSESVAIVSSWLATALSSADQLARAEQHSKRAVEIAEKMQLQPNLLQRIKFQYADILKKLGKAAEAAAVDKQLGQL
jgi:tetratricopeptide (TPR) repeat protein